MKFLHSLLFLYSSLCFAHTNQWQNDTKADLTAIKTILEANHPGTVDTINTHHKKWLESGYHSALENIEHIQSYADYKLTLMRFMDGFNDGHTTVTFSEQFEKKWPLFTLKYRAGQALVDYVAPNLRDKIHPNDLLLTCEGQDYLQLMDKYIFPYMGIDGLESETNYYLPLLMTQNNSIYDMDVQECRFSRDDLEFNLSLQWKAISSLDFNAHIEDKKSDARIELKQIEKGIYRISLPHFYAERYPALKEEMPKLLTELRKRAEELKQAKAIIFDLRMNQGGNSSWAVKVIDSIFGQDIRNRTHLTYSESVDWRASPENLLTLKERLKIVENIFGTESPQMAHYLKLAERMEQAITVGQPLVHSFINDTSAKEAFESRLKPSDIKPNIYLFTEYGCASACLDMADLVLSFPNAIHLGFPTGADTAYNEVRQKVLPSGKGTLIFSMKVYRGKARKHNQPYIPDIRYNSNDLSTKAIDDWLLKIIK